MPNYGVLTRNVACLYISMGGITLPMCMPAHRKCPHYALPHTLQIAIHRSESTALGLDGRKR